MSTMRISGTHGRADPNLERAALSGADTPKSAVDNPFMDPQRYRNDIRRNVRFSQRDWNGECYMTISPTRYCPVGCDHCYFASPKPGRVADPNSHLSGGDIEILRGLLDQAPAELLQITGGGEPLLELEKITELIRASKANRIDINTSSVTANTIDKAVEIIDGLFTAFVNRPGSGCFWYRLSVDEYHLQKIKDRAIKNTIAVFRRNHGRYYQAKFRLRLHSIIGDESIPQLLQQFGAEIRHIEYEEVFGTTLPTKVLFRDGAIIYADYSLRMYSDTMPNLHDTAQVAKAIAAYDRLRIPNPGKHVDRHNRNGLCFVTHEDTTIELWNTALPDNVPSIRTHNLQQIRDSVFGDVIQVASLDNTALYVESFLDEVNPLAVRRAKVIGSATLFNRRAFVQAKDRLYVSIRVIQDYIERAMLTSAATESLHATTRALLALPQEKLGALYFASSFDVLEQHLRDPGATCQQLWLLHRSLELGHHDIDPDAMIKRVRSAETLAPEVKCEFLHLVS